MTSIIEGYEYDIFISYRQNDNKRDGWVTNFVEALKDELEATSKENISIYFDANPHDGLHDTHDVDASLKEKVKCLIFIPIISRTYCDPNSFAWQKELVPFIDFASNDKHGLKVKLANSNIASRILPVRIHDIDSADEQLFENTVGGVMRSVDFVYKEAGVNRPLQPAIDDPEKNLYKTVYRNQINKLAIAICDTLGAISNPQQDTAPQSSTSSGVETRTVKPSRNKRKLIIPLAFVAVLVLAFFLFKPLLFNEKLVDKSIAVLPFENMSNDPEQDYISSGMTLDIITQLGKIANLKVKPRPSTLKYTGTTKGISEIGEELSVAYIVSGSIRQQQGKIRIDVQLIDAINDVQLWGNTYDRNLMDVLTIQTEVAIEIAKELKAKLTKVEQNRIEKRASKNITAYDYYLRAREIVEGNQEDRYSFDNSLSLINQSLQLDPDFAMALALKGRIWLYSYDIGFSNKIWQDSSLYYANKAINIDSELPDGYLLRARIFYLLGKFEDSKADYQKAYELNPNDVTVMYSYGIHLLREQDEKGACLILKSYLGQYTISDPEYYRGIAISFLFAENFEIRETLLLKALSLDPGSSSLAYNLGLLYMDKGDLDKSIEISNKMKSNDRRAIDNLAWAYCRKKDYKKAAEYWSKYKEIEAEFDDSTTTVPFRHNLGLMHMLMGNKEKADSLIGEQLKICQEIIDGTRSRGPWGPNLGSAYYDQAVCLVYFDRKDEAVESLNNVWEHSIGWNYGWNDDFRFDSLRERGDFKGLLEKINNDFDFREKAFAKALNKLMTEDELKRLLDK